MASNTRRFLAEGCVTTCRPTVVTRTLALRVIPLAFVVCFTTIACRSNGTQPTRPDQGNAAPIAESKSITPEEFIAVLEKGDVEEVRLAVAADNGLVDRPMADGSTSLHCAALIPNPKILALLLEHTRDIDHATMQGVTALYVASAKSSVCVKMLLARKANANAIATDDTTPLFNAVRFGPAEAVRLLLEAGADTAIVDRYGGSVLHSLRAPEEREKVDLLVAQNVKIEQVTKNGETPLLVCSRASSIDACKALIAHGANVNAQDLDGKTPLFNAISIGSEEKAELLISSGADVNLGDKVGLTPLKLAEMKKMQRIIALLKTKGAK